MSPVPEFCEKRFDPKCDGPIANGELTNSDRTKDGNVNDSETDNASNKAVRVSWTEVPADVSDKVTDKSDGADQTAMNDRTGGNSEQSSWTDRPAMSRDPSCADIVGDSNIQSTMAQLALYDSVKCGLPLNIFSQVFFLIF